MLQAEQIIHDRYRLKRLLGQNAGRQTWMAEDLSIQPGEPVVVKLLAFGDQVQWDDVRLFEREAQVLRQLKHPRIPRYRDSFSVDDRVLWFGLVQTYIPGASLKELLLGGHKFSEREVRKIATDVLQILTYLHQLSPTVLHRDIKPSNLILGTDRQIYLVDFGAVQDRAAIEGSTFTVVGTYGYAPLEQFGGRAVPASDLYGLGATIVHLVTGISPANLPLRNMRIQFQDRISMDPDLLDWIAKLVEPALELRFQTATAALEALEHPIQIEPIAAPLVFQNTSGRGSTSIVPDEIKGWNWGAFFLPWFWFISNSVWIGTLTLIPNLGWLMAIALGVKGNEWAWKSRKWRSIEQFKAHQRGWAIASLIFGIPMSLAIWAMTIAFIISQFT